MNDETRYSFGEKIRKVREKKKLTMKEVAEKAGVSESLISQIERNRISPAIDTLLRIIDTLEIDLEYIFSDYKKNKNIDLVRVSERNKIIIKDVVYEELSSMRAGDDEHSIEAYYLEIKEGGERGSTEYGHKGKELGIILEGEGEFIIGNKSYKLGEGDSISFESDVPHVLRNTGKEPLKAYWMVTPPKMFFREV